jgi:hypothetical protein
MTLGDLDELGEIMSDMLQKQHDIEVPFSFHTLPSFLRLRYRTGAESSSTGSSRDFLSSKTFITVLSCTKLRSTSFWLKSEGEDSTEKQQRRL